MVHLALQVLGDVTAVEAGSRARSTGGLVPAAAVVELPLLLLQLLQFTFGACKCPLHFLVRHHGALG